MPDTVNGDWWANIHATYYEVIGSSTREVTQVDIVIGTLRTDLLLDEWEELLYRVEIVPMSEDTKLIDDSADGYDCEGHSYSTYKCEARRVATYQMPGNPGEVTFLLQDGTKVYELTEPVVEHD